MLWGKTCMAVMSLWEISRQLLPASLQDYCSDIRLSDMKKMFHLIIGTSNSNLLWSSSSHRPQSRIQTLSFQKPGEHWTSLCVLPLNTKASEILNAFIQKASQPAAWLWKRRSSQVSLSCPPPPSSYSSISVSSSNPSWTKVYTADLPTSLYFLCIFF